MSKKEQKEQTGSKQRANMDMYAEFAHPLIGHISETTSSPLNCRRQSKYDVKVKQTPLLSYMIFPTLCLLPRVHDLTQPTVLSIDDVHNGENGRMVEL